MASFSISGNHPNSTIKIKSFIATVLWTVSFIIAYTQSPLYTSNQNQYFLHGMARAGLGSLRDDWLAGTGDPTPVFSFFVEIITRYFHPTMFYLVYAMIIGGYFWALFLVIQANREKPMIAFQSFVFLSIILIIHSAGWRFGVSRILGSEWSYFLEDGFAGQRILGPVLQPSSSGIFLLIAIYQYLRRHYFIAVILAGFAAIIHPTYLLPAALLISAFIIRVAFDLLTTVNPGDRRKLISRIITMAGLSILVVSPILVYSLRFLGSSPEESALARQILVEFRIPHHASVREWLNAASIGKLVLISIALWISRKKPIFPIILIPGLFSLGLTFIQMISQNDFLALLFPWRISILLVPLSTALITDKILESTSNLKIWKGDNFQKSCKYLLYTIMVLAVLTGITRIVIEYSQKYTSPEMKLFSYLKSSETNNDSIYLIPVKMQDFRLATGKPAYVDFKSIPYQDQDVLEWYRRIRLADNFYKDPDCEELEQLVRFEKITAVVLPSDLQSFVCIGFKEKYYDPFFTLWSTQ